MFSFCLRLPQAVAKKSIHSNTCSPYPHRLCTRTRQFWLRTIQKNATSGTFVLPSCPEPGISTNALSACTSVSNSRRQNVHERDHMCIKTSAAGSCKRNSARPFTVTRMCTARWTRKDAMKVQGLCSGPTWKGAGTNFSLGIGSEPDTTWLAT
jgi:hypothetical protein